MLSGDALRQQYDVSDTTFDAWLQVADWLMLRASSQIDGKAVGKVVVGLSGAQGCGKSTLAGFLQQHLPGQYGLKCLALSLDDFYLTRAERQQLAVDKNPLLATRGVPGTHDLELLNRALDQLLQPLGGSVSLPVFNKLDDDRLPESEWRDWLGNADIILMEGWCVGATPEIEPALVAPINELEREHDQNGQWRRWVNQQLGGRYQKLFERLDALIFLQAPGIEQVIDWRSQQEGELAVSNHQKGMAYEEVEQFVMYYERITRNMFKTLPEQADLNLVMDKQHNIVEVKSRDKKLWP